MAHIRAASEIYAERREALIAALRAQGLVAQQPCDGLNVWVPLPAGVDAARVAQALAQLGWCVRTGDAFAVESVAPALRITVSTLEPAAATRFASQLGRSLREA